MSYRHDGDDVRGERESEEEEKAVVCNVVTLPASLELAVRNGSVTA
jgi:hypothetical protein